jgi:hypothetical protein
MTGQFIISELFKVFPIIWPYFLVVSAFIILFGWLKNK